MYTLIDLTRLVGAAYTHGKTIQDAIDKANRLHAEETSQAGSDAHIAIDRELQRQLIEIESFIKGSTFGNSTQLRTQLSMVHDQLRVRLITAGQSPQPMNEFQTSLSQRIAELPDDVANNLAYVLARDKNDPDELATNLKTIFSKESDSEAVDRWRNYLSTHTITFLGGYNNLNFKLEAIPPLNEPPEVLKLENRFDNPTHMDTVVRDKVPDLCTPIAACRMVLAPDKSLEMTGHNLMVTTLCTNGGATSYIKRLRHPLNSDPYDANARKSFLQGVNKIALQICERLIELEGENIYFPDAKLSNWVVEANGVLRVADTKLFKRSAPTFYDKNHLDNAGGELTGTQGFNLGDVMIGAAPEKIHRAILGRNIYYALTGNFPHDTEELSCTEPSFAMYKSLIEKLTHRTDPPHARLQPNITLVEVKKELLKIEELLSSPAYGCASYSQQRWMALLSTDPIYIDANTQQRTLMLDMVLLPMYELIDDDARTRMLHLVNNHDYLAETKPEKRVLMAELAASHGYNKASPAQQALVRVMVEDKAYKAASPKQKILMIEVAAGSAYEAHPEQRTVMLEIVLFPIYETVDNEARARMLELVHTHEYLTETKPENRLLMAELAASRGYNKASPAQQALVSIIVENKEYNEAKPEKRILMIEVAASSPYEAYPDARARMLELVNNPIFVAKPKQRALMLEVAASREYADNLNKRDLLIKMAASSTYEAHPEKNNRALMLEMVLLPLYEAVDEDARARMLELVNTHDYLTETKPEKRLLMAKLAASSGYNKASPAQKALVGVMVEDKAYEAANPKQKDLMIEVAASSAYEAHPEQRTVMLDMVLFPIYQTVDDDARARMLELVDNPDYIAATFSKRALMLEVVASLAYKSVAFDDPYARARMLDLVNNSEYLKNPDKRLLMIELADSYEYADYPNKRALMIELAASSAYEAVHLDINKRTLMLEMVVSNIYEKANSAARARMQELVNNPDYIAAHFSKRKLMLEVAASLAYESVAFDDPYTRPMMLDLVNNSDYVKKPDKRLLMIEVADSCDYADNPNKRALMIELAACPTYEAAHLDTNKRTLMLEMVLFRMYETVNYDARMRMLELVNNPDYLAAPFKERRLMAELAASPVYNQASFEQKALVAALIEDKEYKAAKPEKRLLMIEVAAKTYQEEVNPKRSTKDHEELASSDTKQQQRFKNSLSDLRDSQDLGKDIDKKTKGPS